MVRIWSIFNCMEEPATLLLEGRKRYGRQAATPCSGASLWSLKDIISLSFLLLTFEVLEPLFGFSGARIRNRAVISQGGCRRAAVFQASVVPAQMPLAGHKGSLDVTLSTSTLVQLPRCCCWHTASCAVHLRAATPRPSEQSSIRQRQPLHALLLPLLLCNWCKELR